MNSTPSHVPPRPALDFVVILCASFVALAVVFVTGCGGGTAAATFSGNTTAVVLTASTANDQLSAFWLTVEGLSLAGQSASTGNLITTPLYAEFIHVNGRAEPLATVSIPQGVYTSATLSLGGAVFECLTVNPDNGDDLMHEFGLGSTSVSVPSSDISVTLPKPITITGPGMALSLNLLVSKSASWTNCLQVDTGSFSITPTFSVTPVPIAAQPTNPANGKLVGLEGVIASVSAGGSSFAVNSLETNSFDQGAGWQIDSNAGTAFQGITGPSQLSAGMPVDMDVAIQPDGSLLATRIAVYDTNTTNLSVWGDGALLNFPSNAPDAFDWGRLETGPLLSGDGMWWDLSATKFGISTQMSNLDNLPFQASFTSSNMVGGQNIAITTHNTSAPSNGPSATTMTLMPQTINGTVSAISSEGGFTTYTVALAPYDLFPTFDPQTYQTSAISNPETVVVYADSTTQMLNSAPIAAGSVERFYGLVFNDNGTLRMDCAQINDGVPE